jgi:hypothetical protein
MSTPQEYNRIETVADIPDLTGFIYHDRYKGTWKVTGPAVMVCPSKYHPVDVQYSYPMIRSTETGKEFKTTREITVWTVTKNWVERGRPPVSNVVGNKVKLDPNAKEKRRKRRIITLKNKLKKIQDEINLLEGNQT